MSDSSRPSVRGRHLLYKAGTKKIVDWLLRTASTLRDIAHILDTPQKKSKSTIKARDLMSLAKIITSADATVPLAIVELLVKVIEGRKACAVFYASQHSSDVAANNSHLFFIQILEDVHKQLAALRAPPAKCEFPQARSQETKSSAKSLESELSNIFARLEVEEPSATPLGSAPSPNQKATTPESTNVVLEDDAQDAAFALWCHCEDLRDLRRYVQDVWQQYARGEVSLLAATMVADTAMSLMRFAGEELASNYPELSSWNGTLRFLSLRCTSANKPLATNEDLCTAYLYPEAGKPSHTARHDLDMIELLCPAIASLLQDVRSHTKQLEKTLDQSKNVSLLMIRPFFSFAYILYHQTYYLAMLTKTHKVGSKDHTRRRPEFLIGLLDFCKTGELPMWLVSAAQTYSDIYEIIGEDPACASEFYLDEMERLEQTWKNFKANHTYWQYESDACEKSIRDAIELSRSALEVTRVSSGLADGFMRACEEQAPAKLDPLHKERLQNIMRYGIPQSVGKPLGSLAVLPCAPGMALWVAKGYWHTLGTTSANDGGMMVAMGHLYSACRRLGLMHTQWHDMEAILAFQKGQSPVVSRSSSNNSDARRLFRQYIVALGVPASKFANGQTPQYPESKDVLLRGRKIIPTCEMMMAFNERVKQDRKMGFTRGNVIEVVLAQLAKKIAGPAGIAKQKPSGPASSRRDVYSLTELLDTFKTNFVKEEPQLNFDHFAFWRFCDKVYGALCAKLCPQLSTVTGVLEPWQFVYKVLEDTATGNKTLLHSPLSAAAAVLNEAVSGDQGKQFSTMAFSQSSGRIPKDLRPNLRQFKPCCCHLGLITKQFGDLTIRKDANGITIYDPEGSEQKALSIISAVADVRKLDSHDHSAQAE
ncbi:uncharacterized protein MYCFIDRAFT_79567 [Pseudocercospora fijiensis CIRAD86]|uniref:DUF6604 domain-containing protein n=1 Tax=Pseudocercospora fijiensis (strain CIRAD86) TaxID=383855 RepID=M3A3Z6_PSEFD|nr:uncharacterized protein MYCFIDRAFT_79567 [Pseudocercospora fijiensis CIRAD86]EME79336.1 hypothetical protein MYCFIDRAFT_79567 [Pseudocercospora fijiensis CIRAD86]